MEEKQLLRWQTLENYRKENSTLSLMLSEFIDNSIHSFEDEKYVDRIKNGENLEITITFVDNGKNDRTYIISDNANGIEDLNSAMQIHKDADLKSKDGKSNYGVGMKWAIFWIGENGKIYTKLNNQKEQIGKFIRGDNDEVINDINESCDNKIKTNSGTSILIEKVLSNNRPLTKNIIDDLQKFLGYRFFHYLKDSNSNHLKMNLKIIWEKEGEIIEKVNIKPFSFLYDNNSLFNLKQRIENRDDRNKYYEEKKYLLCENQELKEYFNKFFDEEHIVINDYLQMDLDDSDEKIQIPIKIGILKEPSKYNCGIAILQSDRYLMHPVNSGYERKIIDNYKWTKNDRAFSGHYKWVIGEIDITKIPYNKKCKYISADKNKANIKFSEDSTKFTEENFQNALENFLKKISPFLSLLASFNNLANKKDLKKGLQKSYDNNSCGSIIEINKEDEKGDEYFYLKNDKLKLIKTLNWKNKIIKIEFNEEIDENDKFYERLPINDENKGYLYSFYLNNKKILADDLNELKMSLITLITLLDIQRQQDNEIDIKNTINDVLKILKKEE